MPDKSSSNPSPPRKPGRPAKWGENHVLMAEHLLARRYTKGQVKELLRTLLAKDGQTVSARTLESILAAARANIVERSGKPREAHRDDAYAFYTSVLQDKNAPAAARIRAQECIDKLLGLQAPTRLEVAGKDGGPVKFDLSKVTDDDLEALDRIAQAAAVAAAVDPDAAGGADGPGGDPGRAGPP